MGSNIFQWSIILQNIDEYVPLNDKTAKIYRVNKKKKYYNLYHAILRTDNGTEFKNSIMNQY